MINKILKRSNSHILSAIQKYGTKLRFYSTSVANSSALKLDPHFITGFIDGEGCFSIGIIKNPKSKIG